MLVPRMTVCTGGVWLWNKASASLQGCRLQSSSTFVLLADKTSTLSVKVVQRLPSLQLLFTTRLATGIR